MAPLYSAPSGCSPTYLRTARGGLRTKLRVGQHLKIDHIIDHMIMSNSKAEKAPHIPPPKFLRPRFEGMPAELKERPNWILWVPMWTGSKWTKRPFQISGFGASSTNPKHWSPFDGVRQAYERAAERGYIEVHEKGKPVQQLRIGGVGVVFDGQPDEDGLVLAGVDFDKIISGGEIPSFV